MREKLYTHHGRHWRMTVTDQTVSLSTAGQITTLPLFGFAQFSQAEDPPRVRQICQGEDGWRVLVDFNPRSNQDPFTLYISKNELSISYSDAPKDLCLDLLELLAAVSY